MWHSSCTLWVVNRIRLENRHMKKTLAAFAVCAALSAPASAVSITDPSEMDQTTIDLANALLAACLVGEDGKPYKFGDENFKFNPGMNGAPELVCRSLCDYEGGEYYDGGVKGDPKAVGAEMPSWAELLR